MISEGPLTREDDVRGGPGMTYIGWAFDDENDDIDPDHMPAFTYSREAGGSLCFCGHNPDSHVEEGAA